MKEKMDFNIKEQREEHEEGLKAIAKKRNKKRPLKEKLIGKNKTDYVDVAREHAIEENNDFDKQKVKDFKKDFEMYNKFEENRHNRYKGKLELILNSEPSEIKNFRELLGGDGLKFKDYFIEAVEEGRELRSWVDEGLTLNKLFSNEDFLNAYDTYASELAQKKTPLEKIEVLLSDFVIDYIYYPKGDKHKSEEEK